MSNFSNTAKTMYLTAAITNVATTATVTNTPGGSVVNPSGYGWPSAPFYAEIDGDSAGPEIVKVTNNASGTLTIVRPSGQAWAYGSVPSAHSMNAPIVPVLTAADIADLANKSYVDSARTNLVINGNGELLDNTNFSPFTFDQSDAPTGLGAFSVSEYNTTKLSDTYIPVDTSKTYRFKYAVRQAGTAGASTLGLLSSYDIDQQWIGSEHCMFQAGTHTVLAQDLDPGDTVVHLASAANWQNAGGTATHLRGFIFWGYTNSKGYTYPDYTYSRKVLLNAYAEGAVNYGANTITLTNPWPSTWGTIPAGTKVSNSSAGNTYNYIPNTAVIPTSTYQTVYGEIGGIDTSGTNNMYRFRPGTAYVRVGWLVNLYVAGSVMKYANISLSEVSSGQLRTFEKFDTATSGIDWFQIKNTGSTPALSVDVANNRIGINKTSPSYALDVAGSALFSGKITVGSDPTGDYEVATKHYVDTYGGGGGGGSPLDPDLTAIANLVGTSGYLKKTAADTWSLDTSTFLTSNQTITLSGDASGSGTTSINVVISDDSHNHTSATISNLDAGDTTTGIFDIARIPTGTTGSTVALGNHTHSYQPADNDLTAIAALSGTGYLRRTGTDTWSLDVSPGTGNVVGPSSSTDNAIARYNGTSGTSIQDSLVTIDDTGVLTAVTFSGSGSLLTGIPQSAISNLTVDLGYKAGLASPAFTGTPTAPTAAVDTNTTQIATTEYVVAQGYLKSATAASTYQPVDGDLTAIAAVSGTGYLRRTGVDTWTLDTPATATWGGITGTLSSQTDLQNALNAKQAADNDLTAIAALTGTGFLQRTGTDTWTLATAGTGDVVGPASATDTAIALYDGTTGKLIKNSGITVSQTGTGIKFAIGDQDPGATGNNVSAPVGSLFTSTGTYEFDSGLWVKTAGTDSTGWKRVIKQYDDEVFDDYIPIFGAQGFIAQSTLKYLSDTVGNVYQLFQSGGNTLRINYPYDTGEGWGDRSNVKTGPLAIAAVYDTDRLKIYNAPPEDAGTVVFSVDEDGYTKTTRLNIAPGSAPASPQDGDMWTTSVGVYARINGVTQGPFESAAGTYQPASGDLTAIDALAGTSGFLKKTATDTWTLDTSTYLTTNQTITLSGDASGSGTTAITVTVADDSHAHTGSTISGLDAGDTTTGTFNIARIPTGTTGTTVALGNHTHSYQPLDADLTAIAALAGTSGFLKKTAADTWSLDTSTYLTGNQTITLSGVVTGSGTTAITTAFAASPTFTGTVTIPTLDLTTAATATAATSYFVETGSDGVVRPKTLANVQSEIVTTTTVNAAAATTVGTVTTGTWNATAIADNKIASALTGKTYNGLTLTAAATGFTIAGGTTSKTLTVSNTLTLAGTDASTLNIGSGGTLGTAAYTASTAYLSSSTSSTQAGYFGDIYLYDDSTPSHYLQITNSANLTLARVLNINVNDADRTISLSGNLTVPSAATVSGTNTGDQTITLTGDVTGSGTGSFATTLAASGVSAGTYNNVATEVRPFTVDAKGRITSIGTAVTIAPAWGSISGKPTTLSGYGITDALSNSTSSTQSGYFGDIYLYDDSTPSHYLQITNSANLTASRLLSINVNDAARTVSLSGDLTVSSAATISGTNTGDQTITLTGNVTGSGTGSFATTIANDAVTYAKMQNVSAQYRVLGRITAAAGDVEELTGENLVTVLGQATSKTGSGSIVFHTAPTFSGTVTASTIAPPSGYLALNYGTGAFDAVRSGQLQVLRDGVGDWNTLFAAYGTAAEVSADTPRFIVYGIGAFEATHEGKIYGTGNSYLKIDGGAGYERQVQFQTAGSLRWTFGATSNAETGSNAGSSFSIARYSDAGAWIDNPLDISRADGIVSVKGLWVQSGGTIGNLPTPTSNNEPATKGYADTALALKAPLASPTFTGDIVVRNAIYIQGDTNGATEGGAELRAGGSTYTFVIAPRNSDATYATSSEFYYEATAYSGTGQWAFEAPLIVASQTAGDGKHSQINGVRFENASTGWRQITAPGDNLRIYGGTTGSYIEFPYNGTAISIKSGKLNTVASSTSYASFNIPHGTAPSSPTNGDIWTTTTAFMARMNGTSVNLLGTQGSTYVTIDDEQVMRVMGV